MARDSQAGLSRGARYLSCLLEPGCDLETPKVAGKEQVTLGQPRPVGNAGAVLWDRIHGVFGEQCKFGERPVVAGLKCQLEEFESIPRVERKSVSSGLHG